MIDTQDCESRARKGLTPLRDPSCVQTEEVGELQARLHTKCLVMMEDTTQKLKQHL
jgi:hypothetical protein